MANTEPSRDRLLAGLGLLVLAALLWSSLHPFDRGTWVMEVAPVVITAPVLFATRCRFPLTTLLYGGTPSPTCSWP